MAKGAVTRAMLLDTAERLFLHKGYDGTSIGDLLAASGLSKGGFYHHYDGKEAVLQALCERHADRAGEQLKEAWLAPDESAMWRINAILDACMPLHMGQLPFVSLVHRGGVPALMTAHLLQASLMERFEPLLARAMATARMEGHIHPEMPGMEKTVLHLATQCFLEVVPLLGGPLEEILSVLTRFRRAIELLLDAPYGTIIIVSAADVEAVSLAIAHPMG